MIYCHKCGTKNEDEAEYCVNCGAPLRGPGRKRSKEEEQVCFGPDFWRGRSVGRDGCFRPYGRLAPIMMGLMIVAIGFAFLVEAVFHVEAWYFVLIILGIFVIIGGYIAATRR